MKTSSHAVMCALWGTCLVLHCAGQQSAPAVDPRLVCTTDINCTEGFDSFPEFRCVEGRCTAGFDTSTYSCTQFCPEFHTCVKGRCVIGTTGQPCPQGPSPPPFGGAKECLFGFICDPATKKCIPGVEGSSCIDPIECQKGLICDRGKAEVVGSGKTSFIGFEKLRGICKKSFAGAKPCFVDRECGDLLCEKTTGLTGTCKARPDYANSAWPQGFGKCFDLTDCLRYGGFICESGICQPRRLGSFCSGRGGCGQFMVCKNEKCVYGTEGSACDVTRFGSTPCLPGLHCKANPGAVEGLQQLTPGACTKGILGTPCTAGSECEKGLICGSSGTCVSTAEGQKCLSSFWCPEKAKCEKISKTCTFNIAGRPASDFMPETVRPSTCSTAIECLQSDSFVQNPCINGLCLPFGLGRNCTRFACSAGSDCVNGLCTERLGGDSCNSKDHCFTGFECKFCPSEKPCNVCKATVSGSNCTLPRNCATGTSCATLVRVNGGNDFRTCVTGTPGTRCRTDRNCQKGLTCQQRRCAFTSTPLPSRNDSGGEPHPDCDEAWTRN